MASHQARIFFATLVHYFLVSAAGGQGKLTPSVEKASWKRPSDEKIAMTAIDLANQDYVRRSRNWMEHAVPDSELLAFLQLKKVTHRRVPNATRGQQTDAYKCKVEVRVTKRNGDIKLILTANLFITSSRTVLDSWEYQKDWSLS